MKRIVLVLAMLAVVLAAAGADPVTRADVERIAEARIESEITPVFTVALFSIYTDRTSSDDEKEAAAMAMIADIVRDAETIYRFEYAKAGIDPPADFENRMVALAAEMKGNDGDA